MMYIYGDNLFIIFYFDSNYVCYFEEEEKMILCSV